MPQAQNMGQTPPFLDHHNPFTVPTDEQVLTMREEEKRKKEAEREKSRNRSVREKLTWSTRIGSARAGIATREPRESTDQSQKFAQSAGSVSSVDKENMQEFISKKREMGLIRMSMSTKLHEIRKLEEEAERAEKRIKQQEEQLDETIQKFEDFLKDNDMKAVEAMKRAEIETKGKQEKTTEIKRLSAQISGIQNEKLKNEEQLQACIRYKKFLDQLTPATWFRETLCNIEIQRLRQELEKQLEQRFAIIEAAENADPAVIATERAQAYAEMEKKIEDARADISNKLEQQPDESIVAELNIMDPDIVPMFFQDPEKILNHFMEIEENNLFLIQNCQETEEGLEELKSKFAEAKTRMDEEAANLKTQIEQIKHKIAIEEGKRKQLAQRKAAAVDGLHQEELLNQINLKVTEIFKASGFGDNEANIVHLGMLTKIETRLEELRAAIGKLPTEFVSQHMKARDKDRRQKARLLLLEQQRKYREERSAKALARSQAPVRKMIGKPVVWRSRPIDKKRNEVVNESNTDEMDDSEFFQP